MDVIVVLRLLQRRTLSLAALVNATFATEVENTMKIHLLFRAWTSIGASVAPSFAMIASLVANLECLGRSFGALFAPKRPLIGCAEGSFGKPIPVDAQSVTPTLVECAKEGQQKEQGLRLKYT